MLALGPLAVVAVKAGTMGKPAGTRKTQRNAGPSPSHHACTYPAIGVFWGPAQSHGGLDQRHSADAAKEHQPSAARVPSIEPWPTWRLWEPAPSGWSWPRH